MPIRRSPNGAGYTRPQPGRDPPEWVVAINRNGWSQSIVIGGRNQPVRPMENEENHDRSNVHSIKRPKRLVSRTRLVMGLLLIVAIPIFIGLANKAVRENAAVIQEGFVDRREEHGRSDLFRCTAISRH